MDLLGPVTSAAHWARASRLSEVEVSQALHQLEAKGGVLRGRFSRGATALEWCERGLLSRIHRLTLGRLRREIEPVTSAQFLRFLFSWQHVAPGSKRHGAQGLLEVLGQLEGFAAAAGSWEREILPARIANYEPWLLDQLCLQGAVVWGRFARRATEPEGTRPLRRQSPTRAAPIAFALREDLPWMLSLARHGETGLAVGAGAEEVHGLLAQKGERCFSPRLQALTEQARHRARAEPVGAGGGRGGERRRFWRTSGARRAAPVGRRPPPQLRRAPWVAPPRRAGRSWVGRWSLLQDPKARATQGPALAKGGRSPRPRAPAVLERDPKS